jgi:hypothetical protein
MDFARMCVAMSLQVLAIIHFHRAPEGSTVLIVYRPGQKGLT